MGLGAVLGGGSLAGISLALEQCLPGATSPLLSSQIELCRLQPPPQYSLFNCLYTPACLLALANGKQ